MIKQLGENIYLTTITIWSWWWEVQNQQDHLARTILTILVPTLLLLWFTWSKPSLPPGPYGLPLVGYLPFLNPNLHETFTKMAHKYGPIFSLRLGTKLHVVVNTIDLAKVVARDLDHTFSNRSPPHAALILTYGGIDIAWSNNTHWRNMRKLLVSQVLSNANLENSRSLRTDEVRKTVNEVFWKMGRKINVNKVAFDTELNVVTSMLWGCSGKNDDFGCVIGDGFREVEFKIVELLGAPNISDFIPMLSRFDLQGRQQEMVKQREHLDRIFDKIIEERIEGNSRKTKEDGRKDFLEILLEHKDASTSFGMDQIKALLMVCRPYTFVGNHK